MLEFFRGMESVLMRPSSAQGDLLDALFGELLYTKLRAIPYLNFDETLVNASGKAKL